MKKLVLIIIMMIVMFSGCVASSEYSYTDNQELSNDRFIRIYEQNNQGIIIYEDQETGVKYLWVKHGYGAGLAVLEEK